MTHIYLIQLQYRKSHFAIDKYFEKHKAFLEEYTEKGNFICCGRKKFNTGEFILCRAENRKEVKEIIANDPFDEYQLAGFEITEYQLIASDPYFSKRS